MNKREEKRSGKMKRKGYQTCDQTNWSILDEKKRESIKEGTREEKQKIEERKEKEGRKGRKTNGGGREGDEEQTKKQKGLRKATGIRGEYVMRRNTENAKKGGREGGRKTNRRRREGKKYEVTKNEKG